MIDQLTAATPWTSARAGDLVTITAPALALPWPLLVWPGRGIGVPDVHVRALYGAIADAMKQPTYPHAVAPRHWFPWSAARLDRDEGFVYLSGPAQADSAAIGYRPTAVVGVAVADLRHLRIRLAGYLGGL